MNTSISEKLAELQIQLYIQRNKKVEPTSLPQGSKSDESKCEK